MQVRVSCPALQDKREKADTTISTRGRSDLHAMGYIVHARLAGGKLDRGAGESEMMREANVRYASIARLLSHNWH